MIILFTDFGVEGPYLGQMQAVLSREAPQTIVINLLANAPAHDPRAAAYLLAAYCDEFPSGSIFLCIVDPGVGSEQRRPLALKADGRWFVGPDNGLFNVVSMRGKVVKSWEIIWRPPKISATFHGRDLFAPVAGRLARSEKEAIGECLAPCDWPRPGWPDDYPRIIYIDHFGNALTGIRADSLATQQTRLAVGGHVLNYARTYSEVAEGQAFWYQNANGLAEIAVNQGRADQVLQIKVGDHVEYRE